MATWITSDLHLNHFKILDFERYNLDRNGLSHIQTIEQYNEMIISRINSVVAPEDTLYILGDVVMGGTDVITRLIRRINGYKILVLGNHDKYKVNQGLKMGFNEVYDRPIYLPEGHGKVILSHYPLYEAFDNPYISYNIHGHLHDSWLSLPNYLNANISMNGYYPINLETLLPSINSNGKSRREPWLEEWFAEYQTFSHEKSTVILRADKTLDVEATREMLQKKAEEALKNTENNQNL